MIGRVGPRFPRKRRGACAPNGVDFGEGGVSVLGVKATLGRLVAVLGLFVALAVVFAAPTRAAEGDSIEVDLAEIDGSGVSGTAVLTEENGAVTVDIEVSGDGVTGGHPAHIHLGTCDALDPNPLYPLASIDADGLSSTTIDGVTLDDLLAEPMAINVHKSAEEAGVYVACGNITAGGEEAAAAAEETTAEGTPAVGSSGDTSYLPPAGVGSSVSSQSGSSALLVAMAALAVVLAGAGITLRVRENRR